MQARNSTGKFKQFQTFVLFAPEAEPRGALCPGAKSTPSSCKKGCTQGLLLVESQKVAHLEGLRLIVRDGKV